MLIARCLKLQILLYSLIYIIARLNCLKKLRYFGKKWSNITKTVKNKNPKIISEDQTISLSLYPVFFIKISSDLMETSPSV